MDKSVMDDQLTLSKILRPLLDGREGDLPDQSENRRLVSDIEYFRKKYPNDEQRAQLIRMKQEEVDRDTLAPDHARLQKILFPEIAHLFCESSFVRKNSWLFCMYNSADFFSSHYRTHALRQEHIEGQIQYLDMEGKRKAAADAVLDRAWLRYFGCADDGKNDDTRDRWR